MKTDRLNTVSQIVFIVSCVTLVGLAAMRVLDEHAGGTNSTLSRNTNAQQHPIPAGARLPDMDGVSFSRAPATLAMVVQSSCPYCAASMPFYKRLSETRKQRSFQLVVASAEAIATTTRYMKANGVEVDAISTLTSNEIPTSGTPTLVLVSRGGAVINSWLGRLSDAQEEEVLSSIQKAVSGS